MFLLIYVDENRNIETTKFSEKNEAKKVMEEQYNHVKGEMGIKFDDILSAIYDERAEVYGEEFTYHDWKIIDLA